MLKVYSVYLICISKVKYTEFEVSYFTTFSSAYWPASLPPVRPSVVGKSVWETHFPRKFCPTG